MKHIVFTFFALFLTTVIFAQAPHSFNYQGVARDLAGTPLINQDIALKISIVIGAMDGNPVYSEVHNTTTSDLGLFSLQVGKGNPLNGIFEQINWGSNSHFLQIEMDENGGNDFQLIGTSELLSVPYALYAENGSLWSKRPEGISYVNENSETILNDLPTIDRDVVIASEDDISTGIRLVDYGTGGESFSLVTTNDGSNLGSGKFILYHDSGFGDAFAKTRISITREGNIGLSQYEPKSKLHV